MKKNKIITSLFVLFCLIIFSYTFFISAQDQNVNQNVFFDSDQDGLSDIEEKSYGTNPNNPDSDGDGYSDGVEISGGYDPLKPAPGDKIIPDISTTAKNLENSNKKNLTKEIAEKASSLPGSEDGGVPLDEIQDLVSEVLDEKLSESSLPEISEDEIKIKNQNYSGLSDKKAFEKRKEDIEEYVVAVFYIFSSNSPLPLTSSSDVSSFLNFFLKNFNAGIASSNLSSFEEFRESGEKILEQMKEIEVPEEMVETHKKGLQFAKYSIALQETTTPNPADPVAELLNVSKIQNLIESFSDFFSEAEEKIAKYELDTDDLKEKLESLGADTDILDIDDSEILEEIEKLNYTF